MGNQELLRLKSLLSELDRTIARIERTGDPGYARDLEGLRLRRMAVKTRMLELDIKNTLSAPQVPQVPVSAPSAPPVSAPPVQTHNDFSPVAFLGTTFALAGLVGLLVWGAENVNNMATVANVFHTMKSVLNPGRTENERRTF